jgi:hypothetical protein
LREKSLISRTIISHSNHSHFFRGRLTTFSENFYPHFQTPQEFDSKILVIKANDYSPPKQSPLFENRKYKSGELYICRLCVLRLYFEWFAFLRIFEIFSLTIRFSQLFSLQRFSTLKPITTTLEKSTGSPDKVRPALKKWVISN